MEDHYSNLKFLIKDPIYITIKIIYFERIWI
jgi:hypothetical protein